MHPSERAGLVEQIGDSGKGDKEPDRWRCLNCRNDGKNYYPGEASADVQRISQHAVWTGIERTAHRLAEPNEHQGNKHEETAATASIGTTNCATSGSRYSVPKKTSCGEAYRPMSTTKPLQNL